MKKIQKAIVVLVTLVIFVGIIPSAVFAANDTAGQQSFLGYGSLSEATSLGGAETMEFYALSEDVSNFYNPEKGWYEARETDDMYSLSGLRTGFVSTVLLEAELSAFKSGPINTTKINEIKSAFSQLRNNRLSAMFRAAYTFDEISNPEPANFQLVLQHIEQLKPIFQENEDILIGIQAGFLGPWGEWHASRYSISASGDGNDIINVNLYGKHVIRALLDAAPESVPILVRTPYYLRALANAKDDYGNTFFSESDLSRLGFHNDGLLADRSDSGTYFRIDSPGEYVDTDAQRNTEINWVDANCKAVPVVAESNDEDGSSKYIDPTKWTTIEELGKLHMQLINRDYPDGVMTRWKDWNIPSQYGSGTVYNYIQRKLGYNFVLERAGFNADIYRGDYLHFQFDIKNNGFGNLNKAKDFEVILTKGSTQYTATVDDDPRVWYKEDGLITKDLYFSVPQNIDPGIWSVNIRLSSIYLSLKNIPEYSVRFANTGVWQSMSGYNKVGEITINNEVRGINTTFEQILEPGDPPPPERIEVNPLPTKTEYFVGEALDLSGMVVTAYYSDDSDKNVTSLASTVPANGTTLNTIGEQEVKVTYTENGVTESDSFAITVVEKPSVEDLTFTIENIANARAGQSVEVPILISNNPGVALIRVNITLHEDLEWDCDLSAYDGGDQSTWPFIGINDVLPISNTGPYSIKESASISFIESGGNKQGNGTLVTLKLKVKEGAKPGEKPIEVEIPFCRNENEGIVPHNVKAGKITVVYDSAPILFGDIFADGIVDSKDVVRLAQYLAGWPSTVLSDEELKAADTFADGVIDSKDIVKLAQYLAGWQVVLGL